MKDHRKKSDNTQQVDFDPAHWASKRSTLKIIISSLNCNLHFLHLRINPNQKPWQEENQKEDTAKDCEAHLLRTAFTVPCSCSLR